MAFGLNRAELIGRLGADVTVNQLMNGGRVANLSIATDESYIDAKTGERVDRTEWHRIVTFQDGLIDMLVKHAAKGRLVYVAGKLQTRRWKKPGEDGGPLLDRDPAGPGRPGAVPGQGRRRRRPDPARPGHGGRHRRRPRLGARGPGRPDPVLRGFASLVSSLPRGSALRRRPPFFLLPGRSEARPGRCPRGARRCVARPDPRPPACRRAVTAVRVRGKRGQERSLA